jgi:hypothetical protein
MKTFASAVCVLALLGTGAAAQTFDDLKKDGNGGSTDNILTYGMGYHQQRYSPLKQINKQTVKRLVPVWSLSLDNNWGEQAQPIIYNGVMSQGGHAAQPQRVPLRVSAARRGPMLGRVTRADALGDFGLDWPTGLLVDVARPVHFLERICRQQFAVGAVKLRHQRQGDRRNRRRHRKADLEADALDWPPETPRVICCGVSNKGAAIYNGKVFRTTLDAHVVAYDAKDGKELWKSKAAEWKEGYSLTVAPLAVNGVLVTGISGAEFGTGVKAELCLITQRVIGMRPVAKHRGRTVMSAPAGMQQASKFLA